MSTVLIQNAMIVDGSGSKAFRGHVFVTEDRIEAVIAVDTPSSEEIVKKGADRIIEAGGLVAAPGFIDRSFRDKPLKFSLTRYWRGFSA